MDLNPEDLQFRGKAVNVISKYQNKQCIHARTLPCTVHMCSIMKCKRVEELFGKPEEKKVPLPPVVSRTLGIDPNVVDRVMARKKK